MMAGEMKTFESGGLSYAFNHSTWETNGVGGSNEMGVLL